jgi:hypothetical protein
MDIANLTNKQRRRILRQVEFAKHAWLEGVYGNLHKKGELPDAIWKAAHSGNDAELEMAKAWFASRGFELVDDWTAAGLGAALKRNGKVISEFKVELASKATLKSEGNVLDKTGN